MSAWPQLSKPIYAGDNFRMAVAQSQQTVGRPPARPTGGKFSIAHKDVQNQSDPPDYRYFAQHDYSELSQGH